MIKMQRDKAIKSVLKFLVASGIDERLADAFVGGMGGLPSDFRVRSHAEMSWLATRVAEEELIFAKIGLFSSNEQYVSWMNRNNLLFYIFEMALMKEIYGSDYLSLVAVARKKFREKMNGKILEKWAWSIFNWDPFWARDEELGPDLLTSIDRLSTRARRKSAIHIPPAIPSPERYRKDILYPLLNTIKEKYSGRRDKVLGDYIHFLGITGLSRGTIETNFLRGHGNGYDGGLLKAKIPIPEKLPSHQAARAYQHRLKIASESLAKKFLRLVDADSASAEIRNSLTEKLHKIIQSDIR